MAPDESKEDLIAKSKGVLKPIKLPPLTLVIKLKK